MKRRLTIRSRLVLLLMLPLLALLAAAAFAVWSANERSTEADEAVDLSENPAGPGDVIVGLEEERAVTERFFNGLATEDEVIAAQQATEARLQVGIADLAAGTPEDQASFAAALSSYQVLPQLRQGVLDGTTDPDQAWEFFGTGIQQVFSANAQNRTDVELAEIRTKLDLLTALGQAREGDAALRDKLGPIIELGFGPDTETQQFLRVLEAERDLRLAGINNVDPVVGATVAEDPSILTVETILAQVLESGEGEELQVDTDAWQAAVRGAEAVFASQSAIVIDDVQELGAEVVDDAELQQLLAIAAAVAIILIAIALVVVGTRSIVRPLRDLTTEAQEISNDRLPLAMEQVRTVQSGEDIELPELPRIAGTRSDEIGQVGDAIDRLQHVALDLAVEQAVLRHNVSDSLLNLARRTQSLVGRQLDELTELEEQETDPDALERLFRLDHLTTRIRRHAESLIVLAGNEGPRSRGDAASIGDVLRAALGEVEDYQRVEFGPVDDAIVHGHAIADLAHLLAELLENGLQFSPPDQPVGIVGRLGDDVYRIAIVDCGVGLTDDELVEANARLRGEEAPTVAPSRYLGLYVAARLANRLGATVQLSRATTGGVLADVLVPRTLVLAGAEANMVEPRIPPPAATVDAGAESPLDAAEVMNVPGVPPALPYEPSAVLGGRREPAESPEPAAAESVPPEPAPVPAQRQPEPEPVASGQPSAVEAVTADPPPRPANGDGQGELPQRRRPASGVPSLRPPAPPAADPVPAEASPVPVGSNGASGHAPTGSNGGGTTPSEPASTGNGGSAPLTRRVRGAQLPETSGRFAEMTSDAIAASQRDADSVRDMLSRFHSGVQRGRDVAAPIEEKSSDE